MRTALCCSLVILCRCGYPGHELGRLPDEPIDLDWKTRVRLRVPALSATLV
jgi:hypothetical protein